jgi:hypothetical protein
MPRQRRADHFFRLDCIRVGPTAGPLFQAAGTQIRHSPIFVNISLSTESARCACGGKHAWTRRRRQRRGCHPSKRAYSPASPARFLCPFWCTIDTPPKAAQILGRSLI